MENLVISKILIPVDFSTTSTNALEVAIDLAQKHKASVSLLHVVDSSFMMIAPDGSMVVDISSDIIIKENERKLDELFDKYKQRGFWDIQRIVKVGQVSQEIVDCAKELDIDLIVMGTHGTSGIQEFLIGSDAFRVVKNASCPVLTVPTYHQWKGISKVLFPIRPVEGALDKLDFTKAILSAYKSEWTVVGMSEDNPVYIEKVTDLLDTLVGHLNKEGISNKSLFYHGGDIAERVNEIASLLMVDLVVITATTDYTFKEYFAGNYSQQVVNHAQVPVLSVRPSKLTIEKEKTYHLTTEDNMLINLSYGAQFHGVI